MIKGPMRSAALAAMAICLMLPGVGQAREEGRYYVTSVGEEALDMVDLGSINQAGAYRRAWSITIYAQTQDADRDDAFIYAAGYGEYDCEGRRWRLIGLRERNADYKLVYSTDDATDWHNIEPRTIVDETLKVDCDPGSAQGDSVVTGTPQDIRGKYMDALSQKH